MSQIAIEELKSLCQELLTKNGVREKDREAIIDHLMENQCSGKASHGMVRLPNMIGAFRRFGLPLEDPEIVHDRGNIVVMDAKGQAGLVAGKVAMDEAIRRAKEHGLAMVGIRDYIGNSGSMAYYLRRMADQGLVAIMGCNSDALVAPPAGRKRMIGTNPIGIAIPGENGQALIADLATSAIAYGKILVSEAEGNAIPEGVLIDQDGNPSTNPKDAYDGAILPLAGHKGFALGLMVELLAGPLIGGKALKQNLYDGDGVFIIAIDPMQFGNEFFYQQIGAALDELKQSPPRPGEDQVSIAGERSAAVLEKTLASGQVDVADKTLETLREFVKEI